jgi:hypothetical protein
MTSLEKRVKEMYSPRAKGRGQEAVTPEEFPPLGVSYGDHMGIIS